MSRARTGLGLESWARCCVAASAFLVAALALVSQPIFPRAGAASPAVDSSWLARAQAHIAEREYRASAEAGGLQAPNRAHGLRTWFEPNGVRVHDRTQEGSSRLVDLCLAGFGRGDALAPVEPGEVTSHENRVEIRRPGLVEWYVNSAAGLEQGFTLEPRPEGGGALVLELAVSNAKASLHGEAVLLTSAAGRRLHYGALAAFDASGRALPARFEVAAADRIRLVVDDAGAAYPVLIDPLLTETPDARLESDQGGVGVPGAVLGNSVAGAGDVDGDGYADVIVGAESYDAGQTDEGAAFVFLGGPSGIADGNPATAAAQLESNQAIAYMGRSVAGAGDVNDDGYDDVIVGAPYYDAPTHEGAAFVFLGSPSGIADGSPATASAQLESNQYAADMGYSVAGAGDVNGDGYDDVIVGAPFYDSGQTNEGAAFVFLGSAAGIADGNPATAAARLESDQASEFDPMLGWDVAGAGDVNGDGYDDVIVGAPNYDAGQIDEGAAFVFLGSGSGIPNGTPATAAAQLESDWGGAYMGWSVAGAGDVNADGYDDVIVAAKRYGTPMPASQITKGSAFVFLGSASGIADGNPATAAAELETGTFDTGIGFTSSVAGAGDVDANGYDDVIVGAEDYSAGQTNEGSAFLFLASGSGIGDGNPATASAHLQPDQNHARMGASVAGAGDVNGDGYDDVIVGSHTYSAGEYYEGAAFVYLGSSMVCTNDVDDDGDGLVDYPADAGCTSVTDGSERQEGFVCDDGQDNDGDGWADYSTNPSLSDPGCRRPGGPTEDPQCQDGVNNDGQTGTDFDGGASLNGGVPIDVADPDCKTATQLLERPLVCGLGFELALVLPALAALRRRARRVRSDP